MSHPDEMESLLSPRQLNDWARYYAVEPWGFEFDNARTARTAWAALQAQSKKHLDEADFMLRYEQPTGRPVQTPEQYRAKSMRAYAGHGGGQSIGGSECPKASAN